MNKKKYVGGVAIDKVQTLLYEIIRSQEQEKQSETETLRIIKRVSNEISETLFGTVKKFFAEAKLEINELLACSGIFIFTCEILESKEINEPLNKLFQKYYRESNGQKIVKYIYFEMKDLNEINAIQLAKRRMKMPGFMNSILQRNQDLLFDFQDTFQDTMFIKQAIRKVESDVFVMGLNELFSETEQIQEEWNVRQYEAVKIKCEEKQTEKEQIEEGQTEEVDKHKYTENHFRIAVIKADLDGMGQMFQNIQDYSQYKSISRILNRYISLEGLSEVAGEIPANQGKPWIFPFYVAGDDIFFAVSIANMIQGIELCRKMLERINSELPDKKLALSIGVEVVFNREPIRYYVEMVGEQLDLAKCHKCAMPILDSYVQAKISISGMVLLAIDDDSIKEIKNDNKNKKKDISFSQEINIAKQKENIWNYFIHDLKLLHTIKSKAHLKQELGTQSFFYTLLEKLSVENLEYDNMKYTNIILYHLLPEYLDTSDIELRNAELLLNTQIIRQVYQKSNKEREGDIILLDSHSIKRFKSYIRLLLLFSDQRFKIFDATDEGRINLSVDDEKNIGKYLFNKPMKHLYEDVLNKDRLINTLIMQIPKFKKSPYYRRLHIEKSMFFRLRNLEYERAAELISMNNGLEEINKKRNIEEQNKSKETNEYYMSFDVDEFKKLAKSTQKWKPDYVDSVMLLYEYNEAMRKFLRIKKGRK
jgi:hypothetical protein